MFDFFPASPLTAEGVFVKPQGNAVWLTAHPSRPCLRPHGSTATGWGLLGRPDPSTPPGGPQHPPSQGPTLPRARRLFCQAGHGHTQPSRCSCAHPPPTRPLRAADSLALPAPRAGFALQQKEWRHFAAKPSSLLSPLSTDQSSHFHTY